MCIFVSYIMHQNIYFYPKLIDLISMYPTTYIYYYKYIYVYETNCFDHFNHWKVIVHILQKEK